MEKRGVIEEGVTPPEDPKDKKKPKDVKTAEQKDLSDHITKRIADEAEKKLS